MSVDTAVDKLVEVVEKLSQPAAQTILEAARMEAYSVLYTGAVSSIVFSVSFYWARKIFKEVNVDDIQFFGCIILAIISFISFLIAVGCIFDPWTWATIFHPELWVAKKAMGI